ncbi:P-loop NTPase fold protein [Luteibacter sp. SG786]|uniref:KAP family P-loop NTPase fold protein n=1 Tax=Luteibacter sp. SG786 TaxID=2587130 RepID=UPI00142028D4|nr:P-loop NTPase fold protein [Luteibacter sp. SG786]NII54230.1 hypothetical protein [Luteibacter sp. SG786]
MSIEAADDHWADDALGRKSLATYLSRSICGQVDRQAKFGKGLTISLDAEWGAGKTFFVSRWQQDLRLANHPVVYFDAWENDIGDEASVAVMSAVLATLREWSAQIPLADKARDAISKMTRDATKKLRRAIVPAASVIAKSALKKATGIAVDELITAFSDEGDGEPAKVGEADNSETDKALDKLFELKLKEHQSRKNALLDFRSAMEKLLREIYEHTHAASPLFIFVDELDRCRPSYALKLLEEIKHIFGVAGVAFVVSTNLAQLQSAVRSLYGSDFDGSAYLKRLFDREYVLPTPDNLRYAAIAIPHDSALRGVPALHWRPGSRVTGSQLDLDWAVVAEMFALDLRSQKQVATLADEVAHSLSSKYSLFAFWLFFLCALFFKDRRFLEKCLADDRMPHSTFEEHLTKLLRASPRIEWDYRSREQPYETNKRAITIVRFARECYALSRDSSAEFYEKFNADKKEFPATLIDLLIDQITASSGVAGTFSAYGSIVKNAGYYLGDSTE